MKYFVLQKRIEVGSPPHLNALLHESPDENGANLAPAYPWYWVEPGEVLQPLPTKLFLHSKDPLYLFDIRSGNSLGEFFVSTQMLAIMRTHLRCDYEIAEIELVSAYATMARSKPYFYIRLQNAHLPMDVHINVEGSKLERRTSGEIKKVHSLVWKDGERPQMFMLQEPSIARMLFVSEAARDLCNLFAPIGVEFVCCTRIGSVNRV
jgi:hypothetical protein